MIGHYDIDAPAPPGLIDFLIMRYDAKPDFDRTALCDCLDFGDFRLGLHGRPGEHRFAYIRTKAYRSPT